MINVIFEDAVDIYFARTRVLERLNLVGKTLSLVPRIGREFMPPLNEGDLMFMPITDPATSLPQAIAIVKQQNAAIQSIPEVATVVAKIARADTSTDPAPLNMTETIVHLKPSSQWQPGMTREKLIGELDAATTMPATGAEVMKPLATPVLGGMVSSLAHVLLVTPVIFYWLRERDLRREEGRDAVETDRALHERPALESAAGQSVPTTTERSKQWSKTS